MSEPAPHHCTEDCKVAHCPGCNEVDHLEYCETCDESFCSVCIENAHQHQDDSEPDPPGIQWVPDVPED